MTGDAEEFTQTIANEVTLFRMIMLRLQNFILHSSTRDLRYASMIDLDQVTTILISSVMTFSELERESSIDSQVRPNIPTPGDG